MSRLSLVASLVLLAKVDSFSPRAINSYSPSIAPLQMNAEGPAGSFFHQVPDEDNNDEPDNSSMDIDTEVSELLRQRKKPPLASNPSTIKGVPTSKATGM